MEHSRVLRVAALCPALQLAAVLQQGLVLRWRVLASTAMRPTEKAAGKGITHICTEPPSDAVDTSAASLLCCRCSAVADSAAAPVAPSVAMDDLDQLI